MRKSELKVGVEYAVTSRPVRGRHEKRWTKPFKATLVDINFHEVRMGTARFGYGSQSYLREMGTSGIAVDTGEKVTITGRLPIKDAEGRFKTHREPVTNNNILEVTEEQTFEYDYLLLENAGCFVSTWEEYEESERIKAERKAEAEAERVRVEQARKDAEADIESRVQAVLDVFTSIGEVSLSHRSWRDDGKPESFTVVASHGTFSGEFAYGTGPEGERVLTGITVKAGLKSIESIIEAARKEA